MQLSIYDELCLVSQYSVTQFRFKKVVVSAASVLLDLEFAPTSYPFLTGM